MANAYSRSKAYVSFQVRVTPELKEQLVRLSYETGVSQASIVSSALKHYFSAKRDPREDDQDNVDEG
ncbi:hypothetical protein [Desulfoscipio gibsoniae]|uniref:Replication regulatory protein RepB n=1 Tax=Desulfoscipio gibsoniae DSM 7213 TaxID=767817 RepID=R4KT58_9FIRM|nr:hypothetical protein [Desulfoscipio gibsoniae]AGL03780.1 Replication regulatory protein RepB [Desulfoscipio gibsoniae DSM 7213]